MNEDINKLAFQLNLPPKVVDKVYKSYWLFIKKTIEKLPFEANLSKEDFNKLRTSFNLPYLGKLYCGYDRWKAIKKHSDDKHKEN